MPAELAAELTLRQEEATLIEDSLERLSDHIADKLSVDPLHEFQKDELFGVMGATKPTPKDGKLLARVTRKYGLTEVKRGPKEKRVRYFVPQAAQDS